MVFGVDIPDKVLRGPWALEGVGGPLSRWVLLLKLEQLGRPLVSWTRASVKCSRGPVPCSQKVSPSLLLEGRRTYGLLWLRSRMLIRLKAAATVSQMMKQTHNMAMQFIGCQNAKLCGFGPRGGRRHRTLYTDSPPVPPPPGNWLESAGP